MIVCPPIAIRSADHLSANFFSRFNFFLIAHLCLSPGKFKTFTAEAFRCLKYPIIETSLNELAQGAIEWQNKVLLGKTEGFLKKINYDSRQFLLPPIPQDADIMSYCPRCLMESYNSKGECPDCFLELRHFH